MALLLLSVAYAMVGINGLRPFWQNANGTNVQEASYSVERNEITSKIPKGQHILFQVNSLPERQETVTVSFYNDEKELIDRKDIVLCNGMNDLGNYDADISFFEYSSARAIDISGIYYAELAPYDLIAGFEIGIGIFFLCCVQYFFVLVKKKYADLSMIESEE